jgi:ribosomal protein L37AE/L43A
MKKCESFGCPTPGEQMYQIVPATNVWLCHQCVKEMKEAAEKEAA